jgi:iron complex transport system ATP-binding protein
MQVENISFAYGRKEVLKDISINITAGRLLGLLGPNGSGKTTLFKCCLGFYKIKSGQIILDNKNLFSYSARHLATYVAYVPQEHKPAFPFLVREMVEMGRSPHRSALPVLSKKDHLAVDHSLERVGLRNLAGENFNHLSGGQRQLVMVARALAQEATLMFLDEPTSSLDFSNQLTVWETMRDISAAGLGVVICCHDPNHILWFCDEVAALKDGRLLEVGPVESVIKRKLLEEIYSRPINTEQVGKRTFIYP